MVAVWFAVAEAATARGTSGSGTRLGTTICMAVTETGATMFLVDAENPGWRVERLVDATDGAFPGGHGELTFNDCRVDDDAVLGAVGEGFKYAQVRLAPARLTHCMRWLGAARRAHDFAVERVAQREAFGQKLGELGMIQEKIARSEMDLQTSRLLIWQACWALDSGRPARAESSLTKAYVAEAVDRVVDRSIQMCGALGVSGDGPLARLMNVSLWVSAVAPSREALVIVPIPVRSR